MDFMSYFLKLSEYKFKKIWFRSSRDSYYHLSKIRTTLNYEPNLIMPTTFNENICHILMNDHSRMRTYIANKLLARDYATKVSNRIKTIPLINIYRSVKEIELNDLPEQFVLKCNHDSGSTVICRNKNTFDFKSAKRKLDFSLKRNMYYRTREWQYKNISPVIICEHFIDLDINNNKDFPEMFRIHCVNGVPKLIEVDFTDVNGSEFINIYNEHWDLQPFLFGLPNYNKQIPAPLILPDILNVSHQLSLPFSYCRVDLMICCDDIYFSEITLSPCRGKMNISPVEWDLELGKMFLRTD